MVEEQSNSASPPDGGRACGLRPEPDKLSQPEALVPDVAKMVGMLTKAQRRIILTMHPRDFSDAYAFCRQRRTRMILTNSGITEPRKWGPITEYYWIRLTDLGRSVRDHLMKGK